MTPSRPVNTTNLDDDWDNLQDGRRQHQIQRGQEVNDLSDVMANFRPCKKSFSIWVETCIPFCRRNPSLSSSLNFSNREDMF